MANEKILISVIVPVYNSEATISRCINSVIEQSFVDWEIVAVDDGSTDLSPKILDEYAKDDKRIHVIHKANSGSGNSRNLGIASSKGKYLLFLDSDDYFEPNALDVVYRKAEITKADILFFNYVNDFYSEVGKIQKRESKTGVVFDVVNNDSFKKHFEELGQQNYLLTTWNKLYNRDFVINHHAQFHVSLRIGEDSYFLFPLYMSAGRIVSIDESLYHYVIRDDSLLHSFSLSRFDDAKTVYVHSLSTMVKWSPSTVPFFSHVFLWQVYLYLDSLMQCDDVLLVEKKELVKRIVSDDLVREALRHDDSMGRFSLLLKTRSFLLLKFFFFLKRI